MKHVLPTNNEAWGFTGTIAAYSDAEKAWAEAFDQIRKATACADYGIRDFLDSPHGRHFADDVTNGLAAGDTIEEAIGAAIATWQGWRIGRPTQREEGIPAGLPYLAGWVAHFELSAAL